MNTVGGWREMKVGLFSRRPAGDATTPEKWATCQLPAPTSRVAFAAIEASDRFGRRWGQWARRLGILDTSNVTVLADGAKWIWEEQLNHLRGATGVLDIFHALVEHIAETSRDIFGARMDATSQRLESSRVTLISEGWPGVSKWIATTRGRLRSPNKRESLDGLWNYLSAHADHLNLRRSAGWRPVDWQRSGRRSLQESDRPPPETDRSPLACPTSQPGWPACVLSCTAISGITTGKLSPHENHYP